MFYVPQIVVNSQTNELVWYLGLKNGASIQLNLDGVISETNTNKLNPICDNNGNYFPGKKNSLYGGYGFFEYAKIAETKKWKKVFISELKEISERYKCGIYKIKT